MRAAAVVLLNFAVASLAVCGQSKAVDFEREIQPIFQSRCHVCHGPKTQLSGLRLDRGPDALKGGASGKPAVVPGKSSESLLFRYVAVLDSKVVMPLTGPRLTPSEIDLLRLWIDQGARWPDKTATSAGPPNVPGSGHWAFKPRQNPAVPAVKQREWIRNPIDNFVLAQLE